MKLQPRTIVIASLVLLTPWIARICLTYMNMTKLPFMILGLILVCLIIFWKDKENLSINYWLGIASVPLAFFYMVVPFRISSEVDQPDAFCFLPFAKQYSDVHNKHVFYKVDPVDKTVTFTPRSEYFWEYHKSDGIADKIKRFQTLPIKYPTSTLREEEDHFIQVVTRELQYGSKITFKVKKLKHFTSKPPLSTEPCIYDDRLWIYGVQTHPPYSLLVEGQLELGGRSLTLDTSGITHPWEDADKFRASDARLLRYGEGRVPYYVLEVCFHKEGSDNYMGRWTIYNNNVVRDSVEKLGEIIPDWVGKE